ncbi:ribose-phosphate pyrophosphokinase, partial [Candidatus Microgenomates bacterium]|nr:ribose-phosphate pyrophosphokinase [Candidatus Microgenomates bacterium]
KNKTAIIVDDMISGGGTIVKAVELLKNEGFEKIFVFATHAVFSQNAPALLREIPVERVFVTDTIFVPREKRFSKLEILSVAQIIAENL